MVNAAPWILETPGASIGLPLFFPVRDSEQYFSQSSVQHANLHAAPIQAAQGMGRGKWSAGKDVWIEL